MANPTPRVRVPDPGQAGRSDRNQDADLPRYGIRSAQGCAGKVVPRKIINTFTTEFNGKRCLHADWNPSISANPYQSFFFKAAETGEFKFSWKDDDGSNYSRRRS